MALLHSIRSSASSELSDDHTSLESIPDGAAMDYSDDQIRLLYQIVIRAEAILSELTPSSRLPTLALFQAYDEILPEHGMDPDDDQDISKLVFLIGGVRDAISLTEKFKKLMTRIGITLHITRDNSDELSTINDTVDRRLITAKNSYDVTGNHTDSSSHDGSDSEGEFAISADGRRSHSEENPADVSRIEQHLENSAIAFQRRHYRKFSSVTTLRRWQKRSNFISSLCDQFDAARQADLQEDVESKFHSWRAIAAEAERTPLQFIPANVYSTRIEEVAVRAYEIHTAKIMLRHWRQCAMNQGRKAREMERPSDPLERVAAKAHRNLMLSRALVNWSNRLEQESEKAQMAAKAYESNLKSRAFGIHNSPPNAVHTSGLRGSLDPPAASDFATSGDDAKAAPIREDVGSGAVVDRAGLPNAGGDVDERDPPSDSADNNCSAIDAASNLADEMDETTMLARRHILRMRYYEAWEKHTAEKVSKAKDFEITQRDKRATTALSAWCIQTAQARQKCEHLGYNAARANYYNKAAKALDAWRQEGGEKAQEQDQILRHYATRANFYHQITKALPVWRTEGEHALQQQGVLELYANRAEYYYKTTKLLPLWQEMRDVAVREKQTLVRYAQRADYYYKTRGTILAWHDVAKEKRKQGLREAHLETRRIVKKGMGRRCIAQWRSKLQTSLEEHGAMDAILEDVVGDGEWRQSVEALDTWREKAQDRNEMVLMGDAVVKGKGLERWREQSAYHQDVLLEAEEYWKEKAVPQVLKNWNLRSLQVPNRPLMVANALEKKERRSLRTAFEGWYGRAADRLVPVELVDGTYKSVGQMVEDAQQHGLLGQARGLLNDWKATAKEQRETAQPEAYTPTPGRPHIFLGGLGRRETTTPLAPVPNWRASDTALRGSLAGARNSRTGRPGRKLRVSWAQ
ncbi:hypothetical protein GGR52DRAFT_563296 [Hypoxylon sp. FL1284]|nr:hypothetical protein GGR52DRAFT_563296 [Hypoxylon sp. FL1284]